MSPNNFIIKIHSAINLMILITYYKLIFSIFYIYLVKLKKLESLKNDMCIILDVIGLLPRETWLVYLKIHALPN